MKREFRLNDRSFSRDPSGPLVTLSTYIKFSQSGGKTRQVSLRPSRSFKRSKWKRDLDCISSRKFLQCSSFGELLFCSSRRRRGKSKWFDPQISFCEFKHKQYRGRIVIRVYFHVWGNPYITEINRLFKVKAENQNTPDLGLIQKYLWLCWCCSFVAHSVKIHQFNFNGYSGLQVMIEGYFGVLKFSIPGFFGGFS